VNEKTPDNAAGMTNVKKSSTRDTTIAPPTPASIRTPSKSPPNQQQQKTSPLSAVLSQPASRKHALEPEDETATPPPKKKPSPGASSTASTPSIPVKSLKLKNLAVIQRTSSIPATKSNSKVSVAKKSAPSTLTSFPPKTVGAKVAKPTPKEKSQNSKLQRLMKIHVGTSKLHELTAAAGKVVRSSESTSNSQTSREASTNVKLYGPERMQTWTNKAASQPPPISTTPITTTAMRKSNSTTWVAPSPYRASIPKISRVPPPTETVLQSAAIQTEAEPGARDTPTAPVSSTSPPTQSNPADNTQPSASKPAMTPSVSTSMEQSQPQATPSSPERPRIIYNLDDELSPSGSDDSLPSPPPRDPSIEIPEQIPTSRKFIVKLRNTSPRSSAPQPTNLLPSAPTSPARAPDTKLTEVVLKSPSPKTNESPLPSPTISELSSLSSQFDEDTQHLPTNDVPIGTLAAHPRS